MAARSGSNPDLQAILNKVYHMLTPHCSATPTIVAGPSSKAAKKAPARKAKPRASAAAK